MTGMEFQNPTPVVVGLVPVLYKTYLGLLTIKRGIPPGLGLTALPGGYLEIERWQDGLSRELMEETGVTINPDAWDPYGFQSSNPNPNRVLLFAKSTAIRFDDIPDFTPNREVQDIGLLFRLSHDERETVSFPLHADYIQMYLFRRENAYRHVDHPIGFQSVAALRE